MIDEDNDDEDGEDYDDISGASCDGGSSRKKKEGKRRRWGEGKGEGRDEERIKEEEEKHREKGKRGWFVLFSHLIIGFRRPVIVYFVRRPSINKLKWSFHLVILRGLNNRYAIHTTTSLRTNISNMPKKDTSKL